MIPVTEIQEAVELLRKAGRPLPLFFIGPMAGVCLMKKAIYASWSKCSLSGTGGWR